jgi:hypothetical protein
MNSDTLTNLAQSLPEHAKQKINDAFPHQTLSDLDVRYYNSVEEVGYDYFFNTVLSSCVDSSVIQSLEPFISFTRLGESLALDTAGTIVIYDTNNGEVHRNGAILVSDF